MPTRAQIAAAIAYLAPPLGWLAEQRYQQLPAIKTALQPVATAQTRFTQPIDPLPSALFGERAWPFVSIIVPARNEASNLHRLLPSLCRLTYPGYFEVIVVDDNSTDATADVARQHGMQVVTPGPLPAGWLGKPHASHFGASVARGDWLLFTDADTCHAPDSLTRTIQHAEREDLDGLSCHLAQDTIGIVDRLSLMVAYASLFAGLAPDHTSLNGQYVLIRRDVYAQSGGFAEVRQEAMDDLAFGRILHTHGYNVPLACGASIASVAMYADYEEMWRGMGRVAASSLRFAGSGSVITALFVTAIMTPLLVIRMVWLGKLHRAWLPLTWAATIIGIWPWAKRFDVHPSRLWLAPFGALIVQLSAMWRLLNRIIGRGVRWKDRQV